MNEKEMKRRFSEVFSIRGRTYRPKEHFMIDGSSVGPGLVFDKDYCISGVCFGDFEDSILVFGYDGKGLFLKGFLEP